jgi:hypothetical protein
MGIYLNPGNQNFQMALNSEIFVDKTGMILFLNSVIKTQQRFVSVSRPRRFGKTMAVDMICAYYDREADSRKQFENRKLCRNSSWDEHLGKYDVIRIVMTDFIREDKPVPEGLEKLKRRILGEMAKKIQQR